MCWLNVNQWLHGICQRPNVHWSLQSFIWVSFVSFQDTVKRNVRRPYLFFIKFDCLISQKSGGVQQPQAGEVKEIL